MRTLPILVILYPLLILAATACSLSGSSVPAAGGETVTPVAPAIETPVPTLAPSSTVTATPEPSITPASELSPTAVPAIHPLEIVEWAEYPYANLADPNNTDTHVEVLVHNPNDFPVRINRDGVELRWLNAAGETVYTNANPFFYIWEGDWILGGETTAMSACVCFMTDGVARQAWETLELDVPLIPAPQVAYTMDVKVSLGEFFSLAEAHLGGDEMGAEVSVENTSGQTLKSIEARVIARDANGKYVGVVMYGGIVDRQNANGSVTIPPGASGAGVIVSEIDYFEGPLVYEITALGIPAE